MASQVFPAGEYKARNEAFSALDFRAILCMENTTAGGEAALAYETMGAWSEVNLDEFDGSGYPGAAVTLDNDSLTVDLVNHLVKVDFDDEVFESLEPGTRKINGMLILL